MDKLDMSLWKILRVSQLSWTNRSRSDLSGREGLSSLDVQQRFGLKMSGRGVLLSFTLGVHCTLHWVCNRQRSLPNSSCVCHLASWHYHQSKVFLDLARILEVAAYTLLPHDPYFVPKNWVKKGEIGHTLGPLCIQGECIFFWAFPLQISEYDSPAHKGQAMFLTDVKCADLKIFWENLLLCLSANANN